MSDQIVWLGRKQASAFLETLGITAAPATMAKWGANNNAGEGPPFFRDGWSHVRYRKDELETWAKKRMVRVE